MSQLLSWGSYSIQLNVDDEIYIVEEDRLDSALHGLVYKLVDHFKSHKKIRLLPDNFGDENIFIVCTNSEIGEFVDQFQKNINYDDLSTKA